MDLEAKLQEQRLLLAAKNGSVDPTLLADVRHIFDEVHALRQEIASTSRVSNQMGDLVEQAHDKFDEFDRIEAAVQQRVAAAEALRLAALAQASDAQGAHPLPLPPPEQPKPARAPRNNGGGGMEAVAAMRNVHEDLVRRLDDMRAEAQRGQSDGLGQALVHVNEAMARMMAYIQGPAPQQLDETRSAAHVKPGSQIVQVAEAPLLSASDTHEPSHDTNESPPHASVQESTDVPPNASTQESNAEESHESRVDAHTDAPLSVAGPVDTVPKASLPDTCAIEAGAPSHTSSPESEDADAPPGTSLPSHTDVDTDTDAQASAAGAEAGAAPAPGTPDAPQPAPPKVHTTAPGMSLAADVAAAVSALQESRIRDLEQSMLKHMEKLGSAARAGGHAVEEVVARMQADFDVKVQPRLLACLSERFDMYT
jgi:hypothetical protein